MSPRYFQVMSISSSSITQVPDTEYKKDLDMFLFPFSCRQKNPQWDRLLSLHVLVALYVWVYVRNEVSSLHKMFPKATLFCSAFPIRLLHSMKINKTKSVGFLK